MTNSIEKTGTGTIEHSGTGNIEHRGTGAIEHTGTGSIERTGTGSIEHRGTGSMRRVAALSALMSCVFTAGAWADTASYATSVGTIDIHSSGSQVRVSWHYDDGVSQRFLVGIGNVESDYSLIRLWDAAASEKIASDGTGAGPGGEGGYGGGDSLWNLAPPADTFKIASDGTGAGPGGEGGYGGGDSLWNLAPPADTFKIASDGTGAGPGGEGGYGGDEFSWGANSAADTFKIASDGTGNGAGSAFDPMGRAAATETTNVEFDLGRPANNRKIASDGTGSDSGDNTGSSVGSPWVGGQMELIFTADGVEAVATMHHAEIESVVLDLNNSAEFSEAVVYVGTAAF